MEKEELLKDAMSDIGIGIIEALSLIDRIALRSYPKPELERMLQNEIRKLQASPKLREYKDRLFRFLFSEKSRLLSLYNALNNTSYDNPEELIITDLENSICIGMRGDISFVLSSDIWLYEDQSTWNPNMPVRMLIYIADIYRDLIPHRALHRSSLIPLKNPHFITFYNGDPKGMKKDEVKLRLSDAYEKKESDSQPELELKVRVININEGHNKNLLEACEYLRGYSTLISKVRSGLEAGYDLDTAVINAINYCIENNLIVDVLKRHYEGVRSMLASVYTFEDYKKDTEMDIQELRDEIAKNKAELAEKDSKLAEKDSEIARLRNQLEKLSKA